MMRRFSLILSMILVICLASTGVVYGAVKAKSVSLNITSVTLVGNGSVTLQATQKPAKAKEKLIWSSSNKAVATVSSKGVVTAISEGNAIITVKTKKSKRTATCKVTVEKNLNEKDIKTLISKDSTIQNTIISLIKKNSLSKDDVLALIRDNTPSGGGEADTVDWKDGTELTLYKSSKNNLTIPGDYPVGNSEEGDIKIKELSVKKYHYDEYYGDVFYPFKYVVDVKGTLPSSDASRYCIVLNLYDNALSSGNYNIDEDVYLKSGRRQPLQWVVEGKDFSVHKEFFLMHNYSVFLPSVFREDE